MVLGVGCGTMATVVTRTLETRRERVIATFLLALGIPCSAQLGVTMALLAQLPWGLVLWGGVVALVFLTAAFLAARLMPGAPPASTTWPTPGFWPRPSWWWPRSP